jgi:hypothetical protein
MMPIFGFSELQRGTDVAIEFARAHPVVALYLKRDASGRPFRAINEITLRSNSHLSVALVNDSDEHCRVLWDGKTLRCLRCLLYKRDALVPLHAPFDLAPPLLTHRVHDLAPGRSLVDLYPLYEYELSWLEQGEYWLEIRFNASQWVIDSAARKSAKLTPASLEAWVRVRLIK